MTIVFLTVLLSSAAAACGLAVLSLIAVRPANLGVHDGRLAACPDSPNCVSTQAEDREHWMNPFILPMGSASPIEQLAKIVRAMPRTQIVTQTNDYLHVEFRSAIFRFCDDVEFFVETGADRVHFRSASRVGRSDLGANRERMELIRRMLEASAR